MTDPKSVEDNAAVVDAGIAALERMDKVLKALRINPERALEELNSDWTASQELADLLMREHGLPFREGHHFASEVVSHARANNLGPLEFPYAEAQRIYAETVAETEHPQDLPLSEEVFRAALDPVAIIRNRATSGGPQPTEMTRMITAARADLTEQQGWIDGRRDHITTALAKLDTDFGALLTE
jgi:argininosuccinate lyase